jgi:glycosyltransferase involved in cell wall biosynthesis
MKLGLLTYGLDRPLTGIGRYTVELANALSIMKDGPEITLLQAGRSPALENGAFRTVPLPGCRLLPGLMTLGNILIAWHARQLDLDVIHDPTGVAPFLFGTGRTKIVLTLHDVFPWSFPGTNTLAENFIYQAWLPAMIGRVNAILTPSARSREDIHRYFPIPFNRIHTIPEGIARCFHPLPARDVKQHLQERFRLSSPFILFAGMIAPRKNIHRLVEAFLPLLNEFPQYCLVLAGTRAGNRYADQIFQRAGKRSDHILVTGPISDSDLAALYNGCSIFVFPSLYEGFGLPPLEAMACGAPVVCSNASSLPEVVGDAARLIDPLDVNGLTDAMREVLSDTRLRLEMREKGLLRARKFSWERNALETMEVYRKVVYH